MIIRNRNNLKIVTSTDIAERPKGLAIVMHGLSGNRKQPHIRVFADAFRDAGFTVVTFDTTNTFGESDGKYEDATITNYYSDLEDVIAWAGKQPWFSTPFILVGHSLGSFCTAHYAEHHRKDVKALAPISAVISGDLLEKAKGPVKMKQWEKTGWLEEESASFPGRIKRLKWHFALDARKYDLLPLADRLTMPVLMIVGDRDKGTPPAHQKLLYDLLPGKKELHIIKNAPHTYWEPEHLEEIRNIFAGWIGSL